jgi:uncharacterized protein
VKSFLPDVNTLLALLDPRHIHHEAAHHWYAAQGAVQLVLCPHVINGVLRVASQPRYPNPLGTCATVRLLLKRFVEKVNPVFTNRDVSLLDDLVLTRTGDLTPARVADLYLLALAVANGSKFATFDTRIPAGAVAGGTESLTIIPIA